MLLGITLGDSSGVGPEIVLRAYSEGRLPWPIVVIGDAAVLEACNEWLGYGVPITIVGDIAEARAGAFNVLDLGLMREGDIVKGAISEKSGRAAFMYLERGIREALSHRISALVTLPMNKAATRLSVPDFSGHTEVLARACECADYAMALVSDELIATHVSTHVSLREAIQRLTADRILTVIRLTHDVARKVHRGTRIGVLGLNPHAGESGAFGDEEIRDIRPAIERAQQQGLDAAGPLPPDTAFMQAFQGHYDALVCMYHDQGHIPMKAFGLEGTANVTLGLPIVRTSVDHGTAFDIAYKGAASIGSFVKACEVAVQLAEAC